MTTGTPSELGYRMPAEWEPHAATWLAWPHNESDWPECFAAIEPAFAQIVRALSEVERVRLLVGERRVTRALGELDRAGVERARVDLIVAETNRSWTRDFLPTFVAGESGLAAVKWRFNAWARYEDWQLDDAAGRLAAQWLNVPAFYPQALRDGTLSDVVMEGGALDVDGEGTLIASETCLFEPPYGRNRWMSVIESEAVFRQYLGVERVLWVGDGIAGDDTFGHVDDFVRFLGPGRLALCQERRPDDANYHPLQEARERLQGVRDAKGRSMELIALPMPEPVLHQGQRMPASYANFYVANERVLVPVFDDAADTEALGILGEAFPERQIVPIAARQLVVGLGTVHCSTQQEPAAHRLD